MKKKKKKSRRRLKIKRLLFALLILLILAAGVFGMAYYRYNLRAVSTTDEEVQFKISKGDTNAKILKNLDEAGLIRNRLVAEVHMRFEEPNLKANTYRLNKNMSFPKILDIMSHATSKYVIKNKLTIREGVRMPKIAESIGKLLNMSADDVLSYWSDTDYIKSLADEYWFLDADTITNEEIYYPLEGYLYPDTYHIQDDHMNIDGITHVLLDEMGNHLKKYRAAYEKMDFSTHEFLTFASIVECETLYDEDRPKIAGVFMNRLNAKMRLQSDVTVNYALKRTGVAVSEKMMKNASHYNTYAYNGLPVGPISSVQTKTMDAVVNYTKHTYLYFFAKEDGTVIYNKTYEDHAKTVKEFKWY